MNPLNEPETDAELMDRLRARNPQALADIYDRYARLVYSLFLRITHDPAAAEDLVQELFLRLWNRARKFDSKKGTLGIWLLSVGRNMALDHVRSAPARFARQLFDMEHIEQLSYSSRCNEPESMVARAESVKAAKSSLRPDERQVSELAYFEGYSQSEIADRLQQPLGTIKSRMRSALNRLRLPIDNSASTRIVVKNDTAETQDPQDAITPAHASPPVIANPS